MAIEVACGSCQGRMMAENPGSIVACPHCGAHLTVPADPNAPTPTETSPPTEPSPIVAPTEPTAVATPDPQPTPELAPQEQPAWTPTAEASEPPGSFPDFSAPAEEASAFPDFSAAADASPASDEAEAVPAVAESAVAIAVTESSTESAPAFDPSVPAFDPSIPAFDPNPAAPVAPIPVVNTVNAVAPTSVAAPEPASTDTTATTTRSSRGGAKQKAVVSKQMFVLVASYACAITAVLVYAFLNPDTFFRTKVGEVENLRDIQSKPGVILGNGGKLPESTLLMPKQKLKIGDDPQRLGNVEVSVVKITKGSITLLPTEHMKLSGGLGSEPMQDGPVLQLWVKFKNVSEDQQFAPIDYDLLKTIKRTDDFENPLTDTFVAAADVNVNNTRRIPPYYNLLQEIEGMPRKELNPGEEVLTLIPSNLYGLDELKGDLIWRLRFRKGRSPNGNGVTTLVDVEFNADDIQGDS